jgi:hypothetical protein
MSTQSKDSVEKHSTLSKAKEFIKKHPNISIGVGFLFIPPLAAIPMWKLTRWPRWLKLTLTAYAVIWSLGVISSKPEQNRQVSDTNGQDTKSAVTFGFDQDLDQFQTAYSKLGFGDDRNPLDYQVDLYAKDDDHSCDLTGWRMPEQTNMRGVTIRIRKWTPTCSEALKLAMTKLTPTLDYDKLYPRISSPEFVREVDSKDEGVILAEGDATLQVVWVDNGNSCPIGQCDLSFRFTDTTGLPMNTRPKVSSTTPEPTTATPEPTTTAPESITTAPEPTKTAFPKPIIATQEATLTASDPNSQINLRATPSTTGKRLGYGLIGDRVQVIDQTAAESYTWYKVRFPRSGAEGWIREDFVRVGETNQ